MTHIQSDNKPLAAAGADAHVATADQPLAELVKQLSDQTTRLARQEVELAKAELAVKGKRAGVGAGMFSAAGILGLYAAGALTATAVLALATAVTAWLAALIVGAVFAVLALALALRGKTKVQQAVPATPEQTIETVKEDVRVTKQRAQEGRR